MTHPSRFDVHHLPCEVDRRGGNHGRQELQERVVHQRHLDQVLAEGVRLGVRSGRLRKSPQKMDGRLDAEIEAEGLEDDLLGFDYLLARVRVSCYPNKVVDQRAGDLLEFRGDQKRAYSHQLHLRSTN